jgi:RHS repeat-associated protein
MLSYDPTSNHIRLSGPDGLIATYAQGTSIEYTDGRSYQYRHDADGRIIAIRDGERRLLGTFTYDDQGRGKTVDVGGGREHYSLTYEPLKTTVTDALGNVTVYDLAEVNDTTVITKITGPCADCGPGESHEWTYDDAGRIATFKDGLGNETSYQYDGNGNVTSVTDALDHTTIYTYDALGRVLTITRPDGGVSTFTYGQTDPTTVTESITATQSRTTHTQYDAQGHPTTLTDARGKTTTLAYNSFGDLAAVTDPLNHTMTLGHDASGRPTSATDEVGGSQTFTYDKHGRVTRVTNADGTHTDFVYDRSGKRTSVTDPLGRPTQYRYDAYGRRTMLIDPLGGITRFGYDLMGNLASLTDARDHTTAFDHDGFGRLTKTTYPGGASETYTYDAAGRLHTRTDRKNVVTTYAYDAVGRLTGKTYSDDTPPASFTYDENGQIGCLTSASNGTDTLGWTCDLLGQLRRETSSGNGSAVDYSYDPAGNRVAVDVNGASLVSYSYDDASRLAGITHGAMSFGFGYDNVDRRMSLTYPNGITTAYEFDALSRLTHLTAAKQATLVEQVLYGYNAASERTSKTLPEFTESYGYDASSRLTTARRSLGSPGRWVFGYDSVGNRLTTQVDNSVTAATYDLRNRLLTRTAGGPLRVHGELDEPGTVKVNGRAVPLLAGNAFETTINATPGTNSFVVEATDADGRVRTNTYQVNVAPIGANYSYDANGSLSLAVEGSDTRAYEWNAENQLVRVCAGDPCTAENLIARYRYDPLGRRVRKIAGGVTTSYAYDGQDIIKETRSDGAAYTYIHGPSFDEPLARIDGSGAVAYYHADGVGSIVEMTDAAGAAISTRRYDAWGNLEVGAAEPGYAFTGREWDPEVGLYYYRARYYDPKVGRFISEDPIEFAGGDIVLYGYVGNVPTNRRDPLGLEWRAPDAYTGTLTIIPIIPPFVTGGGTLTVDRNGSIYGGPAVTAGFPTGFGGSLAGTYINQLLKPDPEQLVDFFTKWSIHAGGGAWLGGYESYTPGQRRDMATSAGIVSPGVFVQASYTRRLRNGTKGGR